MDRKKLAALLLPLAGLGVIAYFVHQAGAAHLWTALRSMGWGLAVLLTLPLFLFFVHAVGWSYTLSEENRKKLGLFRLFALQTFSYGISGMLPLQVFVSEPMKLLFLRGADYDKEDFAASLLLDNTINTFAIFAVAAGGMLYLVMIMTPTFTIKLVLGGLLVGGLGAFWGLIRIQQRGLFTGGLNLLGRLPGLAGFRDQHLAPVERMDDRVRVFYQAHPRAFWASLGFHILEKAQGVAEFWVIFHWLDMNVSWGACFFIFSVVSTLDNLLFFVQVGGMEVWVSSLLSWMKLTQDSIHITAALFRRIRFLVWALLALLLVIPIRKLFVSKLTSEPAMTG